MQTKDIKQRAIFLFTRAWVLCVVALLIFYFGTDLYLMKVKAINHVVPQSMVTQANFMTKPRFNDTTSLEQATKYYKTIVKMVPNSWSDWAFLGYAFFFQGDLERAKFCFHRAAFNEKDFFWFSYNLGVVYLHQGQYELAEKTFTRALSVSFPKTLSLMHAYKSYNMLLPEVLNKGYDVEQGLLSAVQNARALLVTSHFKTPIDKNDPKYFPRMF